MAIILAIALTLSGGVAFAAYNGTAHSNSGGSCGPIDILGYTFSLDIDCVTTSRAELLIGIACLGLAVLVIALGPGANTRRGNSGLKVLVALILLAVGAAALSVYNGTPHYGPTSICAPISAFGGTYRIGADCRVISVLGLSVALLSFMLALILLLLSRPRRRLEL